MMKLNEFFHKAISLFSREKDNLYRNSFKLVLGIILGVEIVLVH